MNPDFLLSIVAAIAVFLLKTTLAFGACLALSRLVVSANFRFVIWSGYVYGAAAYWFYLANALWADRQQSTAAPGVQLPPASSTVGAWQIPAAWAFPLGVTLRMIGIVYLLTLCYLVFLHLRKRRHLRWVLNFTSEPPVDIAERFAVLAKKLHAGRSRLLILSGATSPATFGWIRPTILLPTSCLEDDPSELEDILNHELHHVRRCDAIWNGFALASRTLLFFHPAVWYAVRKMQVDRELACDHAVISDVPSKTGKVRRVSGTLCAVELDARIQQLGDRFCGIPSDASCSFHSGRLEEVSRLDALPAYCFGSDDLCPISWYSAFAGGIALLRASAGSRECRHLGLQCSSPRTAIWNTSKQKSSLLDTSPKFVSYES